MSRSNSAARASQQGMILFISLIVLVALALAALAMFRGSMGTTLIATNVASKQASLGLADNGVQLAAADIQNRAAGAAYNNDQLNVGYFSAIPQPEVDWADESNWTCNVDARCLTAADLCGADAGCLSGITGYTVAYKIHRMCTEANTAHSGTSGVTGNANLCGKTTTTDPSKLGGSLAVGGFQGTGRTMLYFRVTTRVDGPRNSRTVTQTVVSLQT